MYPPMRLDEEKDENGNVIKQGFDYYLKPMNCPMHNLISVSYTHLIRHGAYHDGRTGLRRSEVP